MLNVFPPFLSFPSLFVAGTWTTHAVASSSSFTKVSPKIPLEYAACLSVNPCTALRLLDDFVPLQKGETTNIHRYSSSFIVLILGKKKKKGDVIIQNGANSMVGQSVIQLAKERGIITINVIRQRFIFPSLIL